LKTAPQNKLAHTANSGERRIMLPFRMVGVVCLLLAAACLALGQINRATPSGIQGIVTIKPARPGPIRAGSELPDTVPLPSATFSISSENGPVRSFTTDAQGRFRVLLKPGHYVVSLADNRFPRPCGPFETHVVADKMTHVQWRCDSGMR
jgi:hypothetical protein